MVSVAKQTFFPKYLHLSIAKTALFYPSAIFSSFHLFSGEILLRLTKSSTSTKIHEQSHQIEMQPSSLKQMNVAVDNVDVSSGAEEVVSVTRETAQ